MDLEIDEEDEEETLEEVLQRQKQENMQRVRDLNGPGTKPQVEINPAG